MGCYVLEFQEVDQTQVGVVGGKGALLGELSRIKGTRVPTGFCVTTDAFQRILAEAPSIGERLDRLSRLSPDDRGAIRALSAEIRRIIEGIAIPEDVASSITRSAARLGEQTAYAVRSSATAEDLPTASFAGQHDTYLNVVGAAAILEHISRCWASLFTERAVTYRLRNGFDQRKVQMAVIVQQMVFPQAAGILFTADPVTSNRKVVSVEAVFGLGEALVSGLVNADVYQVRESKIVARAIATKQLAIHASPAGGTRELPIEPERREQAALTDAQVVQLAQLGRRIEAHFGLPQDIEWCLVDDGFQIVQSRPITTLFPIPAAGDQANHVYLSVGHAQMMTDAMKPLGLSVWLLTTPRPMYVAGGRLFVDVASDLASPARRAGLLELIGNSDPLTGDALETILERDDFIPTLTDESPGPVPDGGVPASIETDPAIVTGLIEHSEASIAKLKSDIRGKSGSALLDLILADIQELKRILFDPQSHQVFMSAMEATWWLNEQLQAWLGEKNAADTLAQSVPHNVTSEMGLALLDVADVIRPYPEVVALLQQVEDEGFLDELARVTGGREARDAIVAYLDKYGMRCAGEIDITRPRWSERPTTLVPLILANIKNFEPGAGKRRFEIECDSRGPADGLLRRAAGHLPERRGASGDPRAHQPVLGVALHRAGRDLPPPEWIRPADSPNGRDRAADGVPAGGRHPLHGRPCHVKPEGRLRGGRLRTRRGPGLRPGERGRLPGARKRDRRQSNRHQAAGDPRLADRRNAGTADRAGASGAASTNGCAGRATRAAGTPDRRALRRPPGHRMVPGRRRLPDRPEPADHHAVPDPRG